MNLWAVLIWLVGGIALYDAACRLAAGEDGTITPWTRWQWSPVGAAALGFHLLLLLRIAPDGNLTLERAAAAALLAVFLEGLVLWRRGPAWKWILLVGILPLLMFLSSGWQSLAGMAPRLLISQRFYLQWLGRLNSLFDLVFVALGLAWVLAASPKGRWAGLALWAGQVILGLVFPQWVIGGLQLALVPVVALSLAFLVEVILARAGNLVADFQRNLPC